MNLKLLLGFFLFCILTNKVYGDENQNANKLRMVKLMLDKHLENSREDLAFWLNEKLQPDYKRISPRIDYITCAQCKAIIPITRALMEIIPLGLYKPVITFAITAVCRTLDIIEPSKCAPLVQSFAGPVLYIIENRPLMTANDICGILEPGCAEVNPIYTNYTGVIVPPMSPAGAAKERKLDLSNVAPIKFLQFTDLHVDTHYLEGSEADCGNPVGCCRDGIPFKPENVAGHFGHPGCELNLNALNAVYAHAKENHNDTKFILLTGDFVHSTIWDLSPQENALSIRAVTEKAVDAFPDIPIYPVVGNHEPDVVNMFPPYNLRFSGFDLRWMYNVTLTPFTRWIEPEQQNLFNMYGYYTASPQPGFRIIVINSNLCYVNNFWLAFAPIDPSNQLAWLAEELLKAEEANEIVYIVGHVMPGHAECWQYWSAKFNEIVNRFALIIRGQFYGHSHKDEFNVAFKSGSEEPISVSFASSAVTTDYGKSAYKVYSADGGRLEESTWEVLDHDTYALDVKMSNEQNEAVFEHLYNCKETFGLESLLPAEMYEFVTRMIEDHSLFTKYQWALSKGGVGHYTECREEDLDCKLWYFCSMVSSDTSDSSHCERVTKLLRDKYATTPMPTNAPTQTPPPDNGITKLAFSLSMIVIMSFVTFL